MSGPDIWQLERAIWLEGAETFRRRVDPACIMAFPGIGPMRFEAAADGIERAPRWSKLEIEQAEDSRVTDDLFVLGYLAIASRSDKEPYRAYCTSTWRSSENGWKLIQHQQTPAA